MANKPMSTELYKDLADYFAAAKAQLDGVSGNISDAVDEVVDITTEDDNAVDIVMAILNPIYSAYQSIDNMTKTRSSLLTGVRAINDYVIRNYDVPDPLDTFIAEVITDTGWVAVPSDWAELCEAAGFDIENWDVVT